MRTKEDALLTETENKARLVVLNYQCMALCGCQLMEAVEWGGGGYVCVGVQH